jgi:hypothetical protein
VLQSISIQDLAEHEHHPHGHAKTGQGLVELTL